MKPSLVAAIIISIILLSCTRYYIPVQSSASTADVIKKAKSDGRYFIFRDSIFTYSLQNVVLSDNNESLSCTVAYVPAEHLRYVNTTHRRYDYSKSKGESIVLNEVHLYSDMPVQVTADSRAEIALATIKKIEEINYDKRRTNRQHATVWFISGGFVVLMIAGLAAAAGSAGSSSN